ncbi:MAG: DUF58 domain-containing protein [Crocinitomicaceae bacterium]|nr:DUF58 domain-containing protein [Crocinitomicaceae bacterium]
MDIQELSKFGNLEFLAKQVVEGFITGLHKSPFHGFSVEFAEHRLYNKGESTRHIDWKLYARTGKLFTKRYEEETNLRCQFVLDASSSMYFPKDSEMNKMRFSVYAIASLIELMKKQRDAVGLSVFSQGLDMHTKVGLAQSHLQRIYAELESKLKYNEVDLNVTTNTVESLHEISELCHRRSVVLIFSDMLDSSADQEKIFNALQHLKHNKHEVILFHVVDKKHEVDLEFENRPYTFIDMETGEKIKLNPNQVKAYFSSKSEEFKNELKLKCGDYHIDFVEADINEGFHNILLKYLIKRSKLV